MLQVELLQTALHIQLYIPVFWPHVPAIMRETEPEISGSAALLRYSSACAHFPRQKRDVQSHSSPSYLAQLAWLCTGCPQCHSCKCHCHFSPSSLWSAGGLVLSVWSHISCQPWAQRCLSSRPQRMQLSHSGTQKLQFHFRQLSGLRAPWQNN